MADTFIQTPTEGSGKKLDTRTESTNSEHRQVVVLGDPTSNTGVAPVDATNGLSVTLSTALPAGTAAIGKLASNSGVDIGDVDITSIIPGTGATNLGKAIDTATGVTDTGVLALATRDDTLTTLTPVDGDNVGLRTTSTGALWVQDASLNSNGQAAAAASSPVVEANDSLLVTSIKVDDAAFTPGTTPVQMVGFFADETATDSVDEGDAGAGRMTLDRKIIVNPQPHTAGGFAAPFVSLDLDETEEEVKATAGQLYKLRITNYATSVRYVKLYNDTAANVSVGTTTPYDVIPVPAGSSTAPTVITESFGGHGLPFTALCLAAVTGLANNSAGAPGADEVVVTAYYK
jgi:hypothetical protein